MTTATAKLSGYRQSPRKVRLVANLLKGKSVTHAKAELAHLDKRAAPVVAKLLASAVANAKGAGMDGELVVKNMTVDKGVIQKRMMPRAHGRGFPIHKHTSHLIVTLAEAEGNAKKEETAKKSTVAKKK